MIQKEENRGLSRITWSVLMINLENKIWEKSGTLQSKAAEPSAHDPLLMETYRNHKSLGLY
jgi:hypothetical protein